MDRKKKETEEESEYPISCIHIALDDVSRRRKKREEKKRRKNPIRINHAFDNIHQPIIIEIEKRFDDVGNQQVKFEIH